MDGLTATAEELRELRRWGAFHRHLRIADRRTNTLIPFAPNVIQQRLSDHIDEKTIAGEPVRGIVLKSRRMGVSTIIQMRMLHRASVMRRWTGITGTHRADSSTFLHGMVEQAYGSLPAPLQRVKATGLKGRMIEFVEGSGLATFTAGTGEGAGRGTGFMGIHASEVAFWENAAGVLGALRSIVPDAPGTMIWLESTAHGIRNEFRDEWVNAVEGRSSYVPFFFAWFEFPDYALDLAEMDEVRAKQIGLAGGILGMDWWRDFPEGSEDEEDVLRGIGVSEEQLAWRRFTLMDICNGDLDFFHQEFPATPEQAFLSSGRPFIPPVLQTKLAKVVAPARGVGDLDGEPITGARLEFVPRRFGPLMVWEPPNGDQHLIAADTAGGITEEEEQARPRKERDACAYVVINLRHGRVVAEWTAQTDADTFACDLARAGWIYQDAERLPCEIAVESNNMGLLTLKELRDRWFYPRIYHRESLSHEHRGQRTKTIGWLTTMANRGAILANLLAVVRDHPTSLPSRRLLDQIRTFVWVTDKRVEHELGAHDDLVFATAIGYQLFSMRSHYQQIQAKPETVPTTTAELEALLERYTVRPPARTLRETVLATRRVRSR